jgi:hypothetical protein
MAFGDIEESQQRRWRLLQELVMASAVKTGFHCQWGFINRIASNPTILFFAAPVLDMPVATSIQPRPTA